MHHGSSSMFICVSFLVIWLLKCPNMRCSIKNAILLPLASYMLTYCFLRFFQQDYPTMRYVTSSKRVHDAPANNNNTLDLSSNITTRHSPQQAVPRIILYSATHCLVASIRHKSEYRWLWSSWLVTRIMHLWKLPDNSRSDKNTRIACKHFDRRQLAGPVTIVSMTGIEMWPDFW